ncbi:hypothetical protein C8R45DRAFT_938130 [Mycena sanguinolenta]|nr:hypothetical protein C8R45DRAFT_938130 [Mycena sanguinolenta]
MSDYTAEIPQDTPAEGLVRPPKPVRATRQNKIRKGPPVDSVQDKLFTWRRNIKKMHFPQAMFAPSAILNDATCETLASIGPVEDVATLQLLLQSTWSRWDEFGTQLFVYMKGLDIPLRPPPPSRKKAAPASGHVSIPSTPSSSLSATQTQEPSSRGANSEGAKRSHPTHNTPADSEAVPSTKRRGRPRKNPSAPKPTSTAAPPPPRPIYRGYMTPSLPSQSPVSYPAYPQLPPLSSATPPRFPAGNINHYLPPTPQVHPSPFTPYSTQSAAGGHATYSFSSLYPFSPAPMYPMTPRPHFNHYPLVPLWAFQPSMGSRRRPPKAREMHLMGMHSQIATLIRTIPDEGINPRQLWPI